MVAHITINPGEHKPSYMREIIKAIKSKNQMLLFLVEMMNIEYI